MGPRSIASVQIDVPETLAMEGRGSFYESTGALRDMVSTHLFQILGSVALEDPGELVGDRPYDEREGRGLRATSVRSTRRASCSGSTTATATRTDVAEDSDVETFVALEAWVDNDRWRDVPFLLRTGKAMAETRRTVTLRFRDPATRRSSAATACGADELVLELTDEARIHVDLLGQATGPEMELAPATMRLDLGEELPDDEPLEAYERLLLDVMRGDHTLFTHADETRPAVGGVPAGARRPAGAAAVRPGVVGTRRGARPARGRLAARERRRDDE